MTPSRIIANDVERKVLEHQAGQAVLSEVPDGWEITLYSTRRVGKQERFWCAYAVKIWFVNGGHMKKSETAPFFADLPHLAFARAVADAKAFDEKGGAA